MNGPETSREDASDAVVVAARTVASDAGKSSSLALRWHRAETERLRVLVDFLSRPIHAPGGMEPDPDVLSAYNLAVEAALSGIRRAAGGRVETPSE